MSLNYIPHGHCYLWQTPLVGLHVSSDLITAIAYYSIPVTLLVFVRKRRDLPFAWLFVLFSAFILSCGTAHLMAIWTLWYPDYWLSGAVKAVMATISIATAFVLVPVIPQALALPTPAQLAATNADLQQANANLQAEILARQAAQAAMEQSQAILRRTLAFERQLYALTEKLRHLTSEQEVWQTVVTHLDNSLATADNVAFWDFEREIATHPLTPAQQAVVHTLPTAQGSPSSLLTHPLGDATFATVMPVYLMGQLAGALWCFHTDLLKPAEQRTLQQMTLQGLFAVRQIQLSAAMASQLTEAEHLNQLKDDFVSTVSHELRTPMTSMKLALTMLQPLKSGLNERQLKYWQILESQCDQEIALINDLLDFQAFMASDIGDLSTINLDLWLGEQLMATEAQMQANGLSLTTQLTAVQLTTHEPTLQRIVQELLTNACKYTPQGGQIGVEVSLNESEIAMASDQPLVVIAIKNTGTPISPSEQAKVFDAFYRSQRDHGKRGTGLGLALVKRQVERLGGQISLTSTHEWTTFTLHLPLHLASEQQTELPPASLLED